MTEDILQAKLVIWLSRTYPELWNLTYHCMNNPRSKADGSRLKAMGLRAGIPDLNIDLPRGNFAGMRLELKAEKGARSKVQEEWGKKLEEAGFFYYCAHSLEAAKAAIEHYASLGPSPLFGTNAGT